MNLDQTPVQTDQLDALVFRLSNGDAEARNELLMMADTRLRRLARKMLRDYPGVHRREDTDDVFQQAMLRLWRALEKAKIESSRHFLNLAALQIRRQLIDLSRREIRQFGFDSAAPSSSTAGELPREADCTTWDPQKLSCWTEFHEAIEKLAEAEQEVVNLLFYQGLTQPEAAKAIGVSERTVQRLWQSARLRLYELLEGELPD